LKVNVKGLCPAAWVEALPALKLGANPPEHPVMLRVLDGVDAGVYGVLHGTTTPLVVIVPQFCEFVRGALGPVFVLTVSVLNGSWGLFSKLVVICPVVGFTEA
jgi:hypothetical protein